MVVLSENLLDLDCVDATGRDETVAWFRQHLPHALRVHSIGHMVRSVQQHLGEAGRIRRLRVFGHGAPGIQGLGRSHEYHPKRPYLNIQVSKGQLQYRDVLSDLQGRFSTARPRGWVELHGCQVGAGGAGGPGQALALALAQLWQVPIAAGAVIQNTDAGFETCYIVAYPNGRVQWRTGHYVTSGAERGVVVGTILFGPIGAVVYGLLGAYLD